MDTIQPYSLKPVPCGDMSVYRGLTFDSGNFYLTCPDLRQIHKYGTDLCRKELIKVKRGYGPICFDRFCSCFWAICSEESNRIYKLNRFFTEKGCITVHFPGSKCIITGISCIDEDKLEVCGDFGTARLSKQNYAEAEDIQISKTAHIHAVTYTPFGTVSARSGNYSDTIVWADEKNGVHAEYCLSDRYFTEDLEFREAEHSKYIYALVNKYRSYSYILICRLGTGSDGKNIQTQSYPAETVCRGSDKNKNQIKNRLNEKFENTVHKIEERQKCTVADSPKSKSDSCCAEELIRSVALVETALSRILNAESEKIRSVLCNGTPEQILQTNCDVRRTITDITQLEQVLYAKIQAVSEMCSAECCSIGSCDRKSAKLKNG